MRMSRGVVVLLLLLQLLTLTPHASAAPESLTFIGSGFGHGVGMSQIGARAKALAGESATAILAYYYTGVEIASVIDTQSVRINIGHELTNFKLRTDDVGAFVRVYDQNKSPLLEAPSRTSLIFALHDGLITLTTTQGKRVATFPGLSNLLVRWSGTSELEGAPAILSMTQQSGTRRYKFGEINIAIVRSPKFGLRLEVTNTLRLGDEYLYGISEMPSSWPSAALEAQAIASRTYALYRSTTYRPQCDCTMYATISDQHFVGYSKLAEPRVGQLWKAAVDRTVGVAMRSQGNYFPAYFFSSSGGVTETALNAFGTGTAFAQSVPDSASADIKLNPRYATWKVSVPQATLATAFGLPDVVNLSILMRNQTGTVGRIEATSSAGKKVSLRGETFRSRAKLPSAWFSISS